MYSYRKHFWEVEKDVYVTGVTVVYQNGRIVVDNESFCYFFLEYDALAENPYGQRAYHNGIKEQFYQAIGKELEQSTNE